MSAAVAEGVATVSVSYYGVVFGDCGFFFDYAFATCIDDFADLGVGELDFGDAGAFGGGACAGCVGKGVFGFGLGG